MRLGVLCTTRRGTTWKGGVSEGVTCVWCVHRRRKIKNSMYLVEPVDPSLCIPCKANPYHLACRVCKAFAHDGICKHVLAVTHLLEKEKP